jgi:hypothetical protein
MTAPGTLALRSLALGHDQEASACHWAQLTRRTAEYPSRRAQLALAVMERSVPLAPDVVALLYRCDDCARCRAHSSLPQPPDLARALWPVRAWLVEQGAVPEVEALRSQLRAHGHLCGDLSRAWASLGLGEAGASTVFVPDGAVLALEPGAAQAALDTARCIIGPVAVLNDIPDVGQVLREVGLASEAEQAQETARQHIVAGGYRRVLAGTPKETAALREVLKGLTVDVQYVGSALAQAALRGNVRLRAVPSAERRIMLHPSAALLEDAPAYSLITDWLGGWLAGGFCLEPDTALTVWPAAVERPAIGLDPAQARRLARHRLDQLMAWRPSLILTCDPYSQRALREAAPAGVDVVDLLVFARLHVAEVNS